MCLPRLQRWEAGPLDVLSASGTGCAVVRGRKGIAPGAALRPRLSVAAVVGSKSPSGAKPPWRLSSLPFSAPTGLHLARRLGVRLSLAAAYSFSRKIRASSSIRRRGDPLVSAWSHVGHAPGGTCCGADGASSSREGRPAVPSRNRITCLPVGCSRFAMFFLAPLWSSCSEMGSDIPFHGERVPLDKKARRRSRCGGGMHLAAQDGHVSPASLVSLVRAWCSL